jgi:SHS2 domain-containing protein
MSKERDDEIFRELEHTADVGIEVAADSRAELFRRAAIAVARLMVDTARVRAVHRREVSIAADDDVNLMHDMLSALLHTFMVDNFIWSEVAVEADQSGLKVALAGEPFDPDRHEFYQEIKAVTYHQMSVTNADGRWMARIIFDV